MINNKNMIKENKIVIATRTGGTDEKGFAKCVKKLEKLSRINAVFKSYIICNCNGKINDKIYLISDPEKNPTRATAFNLVIKELKDIAKKSNSNKKNKYHLLTFSKEVRVQQKHINEMIKELESNEEKIIVAGYRLKDNILSREEYKQFADGNKNDNYGIAYQVPWNTCALWNKEFVYGSGKKKLIFDKICEKDKNQLGELRVKVDGKLLPTDYEGMEDGLAIAALISNNKNLNFKLIDEELDWEIIEEFKEKIEYKEYKIKIIKDCKKILKHKVKMARKNIVLNTFMNIKGYSIDKLMKD